MTERDTVVRFLFPEHGCRGELVRLDGAWQSVCAHADYPTAVRGVLGEALAASALLASTIKLDGRLGLQVRGKGPVSLLLAQARSDGGLRAMARCRGQPGGDLQALFGDAQLAITIETGPRQERYQGLVSLQHARLAQALEAYFVQSEQLATRLWLSAGRHRCAGLLLQRLPEDAVENGDEAWGRLGVLTDTLRESELHELPALQLLRRLYHDETVQVLDGRALHFACTCSRERTAAMLRGLGETEVREMLAERGEVEVRCEFCSRSYRYGEADVDALFATLAGGAG